MNHTLPIIIVILISLLVGLAVHIGQSYAHNEIAQQCERQGEFTADGYRYECTRIGRSNE